MKIFFSKKPTPENAAKKCGKKFDKMIELASKDGTTPKQIEKAASKFLHSATDLMQIEAQSLIGHKPHRPKITYEINLLSPAGLQIAGALVLVIGLFSLQLALVLIGAAIIIGMEYSKNSLSTPLITETNSSYAL